MTIYHVEFAKVGFGLSGGEVCMLELIKYFDSKGYKNVILTTENGKDTYAKLLPDAVGYVTIPAYLGKNRMRILASYLSRAVRAAVKVSQQHMQPEDIIICHSEFLPNSIPSWVLHRNNSNSFCAYFFHRRAAGIFRGYKGQFTGSFEFPSPTTLYHLASQWIYRRLTRNGAVILAVNPQYYDFLRQMYPRNKVLILEHFGEGSHELSQTTSQGKKFDLVWVGRTHPQKGLEDFLHVVKRVSRSEPTLSAVVVGEGLENLYSKRARDLGIGHMLTFAGFVSGEAKFDLIKSCKIFVATSHFESFGMSVLEAMACGLPVAGYSLPAYKVFGDGIITAPPLETDALAQVVETLLKNRKAYDEASAKAYEASRSHSWRMTGEDIINALKAT